MKWNEKWEPCHIQPREDHTQGAESEIGWWVRGFGLGLMLFWGLCMRELLQYHT